MTRDEARGQAALQMLDKYSEPQSLFIASDGIGAKLYELENKRNELIKKCAEQWAQIAGATEAEFWTRSLPQALHDTLDSYQAESAIVAAEAFLKRLGWTVERPVAKLEKAS